MYEDLKNELGVTDVQEFMDSDAIEQAKAKYGWSGEKIDKYCTTGKQFIYMANLSIKSKAL